MIVIDLWQVSADISKVQKDGYVKVEDVLTVLKNNIKEMESEDIHIRKDNRHE